MHRRHKGREAALSLLLALPFLLPLLLSLGFTFLGDWEVRQLLREVGRYEDGVFLPLRLPPMEASLGQYADVLLHRPEILTTFFNSLGYVLLSVGGMLLVAPPAAFAFAKLRFRGREVLFYGYVLALLLPFQVLCVPLTLDDGRTALAGHALGHRAAGGLFPAAGVSLAAILQIGPGQRARGGCCGRRAALADIFADPAAAVGPPRWRWLRCFPLRAAGT